MLSPKERFKELLLSQYKASPNLIGYMSAFVESQEELYQMFKQILTERYLDNATGTQLDIIGDIVGCKRVLENVPKGDFYGFFDEPLTLGAADEAIPLVGGILFNHFERSTYDFELADKPFKDWIYARILKNHTNCNTEDVIEYFQLLLGDPDLLVEVVDTDSAEVTVTLHMEVAIQQLAVLSVTAQHIKPTGVGMILQDDNGVITTKPIEGVL